MPRKRKAKYIDSTYPPKKKRTKLLSTPKCLSKKGNVSTCGLGDCGQLGLGSNPAKIESCYPQIIDSIKDAVDICAGGMHSLVLTKDGKFWSFGCNDECALGRNTTEEYSEYVPGLVDLPAKAVKISAGDSHSACILENGAVMAWGSFRNSKGSLGLTLEGKQLLPFAVLPSEVCCSIASGADHLVILTCSGYIYTIGNCDQGQLGRISSRSASSDGIRLKRKLLQPLKVTLPLFQLADAIWASNSCTFVQASYVHRIFGFGLNNFQQLAYDEHIHLQTKPVLLNTTDVKEIAGGQHHTMILQNNGTIHVIGNHNYGRLGLGHVNKPITKLKTVETLCEEFFTDISCGDATSFAITQDGNLYVWGIGTNYRLGTGNDRDVSEPKRITNPNWDGKRILRVSSGGQHSIFLVENRNRDEDVHK